MIKMDSMFKAIRENRLAVFALLFGLFLHYVPYVTLAHELWDFLVSVKDLAFYFSIILYHLSTWSNFFILIEALAQHVNFVASVITIYVSLKLYQKIVKVKTALTPSPTTQTLVSVVKNEMPAVFKRLLPFLIGAAFVRFARNYLKKHIERIYKYYTQEEIHQVTEYESKTHSNPTTLALDLISLGLASAGIFVGSKEIFGKIREMDTVRRFMDSVWRYMPNRDDPRLQVTVTEKMYESFKSCRDAYWWSSNQDFEDQVYEMVLRLRGQNLVRGFQQPNIVDWRLYNLTMRVDDNRVGWDAIQNASKRDVAKDMVKFLLEARINDYTEFDMKVREIMNRMKERLYPMDQDDIHGDFFNDLVNAPTIEDTYSAIFAHLKKTLSDNFALASASFVCALFVWYARDMIKAKLFGVAASAHNSLGAYFDVKEHETEIEKEGPRKRKMRFGDTYQRDYYRMMRDNDDAYADGDLYDKVKVGRNDREFYECMTLAASELECKRFLPGGPDAFEVEAEVDQAEPLVSEAEPRAKKEKISRPSKQKRVEELEVLTHESAMPRSSVLSNANTRQVFKLTSGNQLGSAFPITIAGRKVLMSATHCIDLNRSTHQVHYNIGDTRVSVPTRLIATIGDLAVLDMHVATKATPEIYAKVKPFKLSTKVPEVSDPIGMVGTSRITTGVVHSVRRSAAGLMAVAYDCSTEPGESGSPIVRGTAAENGAVLAVHSGSGKAEVYNVGTFLSIDALAVLEMPITNFYKLKDHSKWEPLVVPDMASAPASPAIEIVEQAAFADTPPYLIPYNSCTHHEKAHTVAMARSTTGDRLPEDERQRKYDSFYAFVYDASRSSLAHTFRDLFSETAYVVDDGGVHHYRFVVSNEAVEGNLWKSVFVYHVATGQVPSFACGIDFRALSQRARAESRAQGSEEHPITTVARSLAFRK